MNFNSPTQLSLLFFGGAVKEKVDEPVLNELGVPVTIKTGARRGEVKTHKVDKVKKFKGLGLKPLKEWRTKKEGIYQVNEKVLQLLAQRKDSVAGEIATLMLEVRSLEKLLGTYYEGFEELIDEKTGCIHPQFQNCKTDTGRLSCAKPNLQNIPRD